MTPTIRSSFRLRRASLRLPLSKAIAHLGSPGGFVRIIRRHRALADSGVNIVGACLNIVSAAQIDANKLHLRHIGLGKHRTNVARETQLGWVVLAHDPFTFT